VIITGAGVTLNATADADGEPLARITWPGLLANGLDYLIDGHVEQSNTGIQWAYKALEQENAYGTLHAADVLRSEMKKAGQFATWLESVFANLSQEVRHPALLNVIKALHENGDVLEKFCGLDGIGRSNRDKFLKFQRGDLPGVLHIHGSWSETNEVVLDTKDYYEVSKSAGLQDLLKYFLQCKTILFIGYGSGLEDPNFNALLKWASEQ
jgi:hypothetical protein